MKNQRDWLVLGVLLLVFVPTMHFAWRMFATDWLALQPRVSLIKWGADQAPLNVSEWVQARNQTQQALAMNPGNPMLHDLLASLYLLRAQQSRAGSAFATSMYTEAVAHQQASLALRPGHGWAWAGLAQSLLALNPANPEGWQAWRNANQQGPYELQISTTLYFAAKRAGTHAPPDVQQWLHQTEQNAPPRLRGLLGLKPLNAPKK
jgi:predicted Zn-dependent protease